MKFRFISKYDGTFKVGRMCQLFNVSRGGYYAWLKRPKSRRSRENEKLKATRYSIFFTKATGRMVLRGSMRNFVLRESAVDATALLDS